MSILQRFGMHDCNPVSTPSYGAELSLDQPADSLLDEDGIKAYQFLAGCLLHVLELTRTTSKPSKAHWFKAKNVLRYIKGRPQLDIDLVYRSGEFKIQAWAIASFAQDLEERRSRIGYLFLLSGAPTSWCSALQSLTAVSTVEAEMVSMSYAAREANRDNNVSVKYSSFVSRRAPFPPGSPVVSILRAARFAEPSSSPLLSTPCSVRVPRDVDPLNRADRCVEHGSIPGRCPLLVKVADLEKVVCLKVNPTSAALRSGALPTMCAGLSRMFQHETVIGKPDLLCGVMGVELKARTDAGKTRKELLPRGNRALVRATAECLFRCPNHGGLLFSEYFPVHRIPAVSGGHVAIGRGGGGGVGGRIECECLAQQARACGGRLSILADGGH